MWMHVYPNRKTNINSKNGRNRSFSYETKPSISFIPMRGMCLWCPIVKWKDITMSIRVYQDWKTNFYFKNGGNSSFSYETKALISFIPMKRLCFWCPIMKWKEMMMQIRVYPNWRTNFNSKNGRKRSFSYETKPSISFIPMRGCVYGAYS